MDEPPSLRAQQSIRRPALNSKSVDAAAPVAIRTSRFPRSAAFISSRNGEGFSSLLSAGHAAPIRGTENRQSVAPGIGAVEPSVGNQKHRPMRSSNGFL